MGTISMHLLPVLLSLLAAASASASEDDPEDPADEAGAADGPASYGNCVFVFPTVCLDTKYVKAFIVAVALSSFVVLFLLGMLIAHILILRRHVVLSSHYYTFLYKWNAEAIRNFLDDPSPGWRYFKVWLCSLHGYERIPDNSLDSDSETAGQRVRRQPGRRLNPAPGATNANLGSSPGRAPSNNRPSGTFGKLFFGRRERPSSPEGGGAYDRVEDREELRGSSSRGAGPRASPGASCLVASNLQDGLEALNRSSEIRRKARKERLEKIKSASSSSDAGSPSTTSNEDTMSAMHPEAPRCLGSTPATEMVSSTLRSSASTRLPTPSVTPLPPRCASAPVPDARSVNGTQDDGRVDGPNSPPPVIEEAEATEEQAAGGRHPRPDPDERPHRPQSDQDVLPSASSNDEEDSEQGSPFERVKPEDLAF